MIKKIIIAIFFASACTMAADAIYPPVTLTCGPMCSGKTKKLLEDVEKFQSDPHHIPLTISYARNCRDGENIIVSRSDPSKRLTATTTFGENRVLSIALKNCYSDILTKAASITDSNIKNNFDFLVQYALYSKYKIDVFIDECQFLSNNEILELKYFMDETGVGMHFYGLNRDFKKDFFDAFNEIVRVFYPKIERLKAKCEKCGRFEASYTGRFTHAGKFITTGPVAVIEGSTPERYYPICSLCWGQDIS